MEVEDRLRGSVKSVMVSCGNLLNYLSTNNIDRVVPNPPTALHGPIDRDIRQYQSILDEVDVAVQLTRKRIHTLIEQKKQEELKRKKQEEEQAKNGSDIKLEPKAESNSNNNNTDSNAPKGASASGNTLNEAIDIDTDDLFEEKPGDDAGDGKQDDAQAGGDLDIGEQDIQLDDLGMMDGFGDSLDTFDSHFNDMFSAVGANNDTMDELGLFGNSLGFDNS